MAESKKRAILNTPAGIARFPRLNQPDTSFDPDGKYKVDLLMDPAEAGVTEFLTMLGNHLKANKPGGRMPVKEEVSDDGTKTGKVIVRFASSFKPKLFDAYGHQIPDEVIVGSGSVIKVAFEENFYPAFGGGMNLYLQAVQVLDLHEYKPATLETYGFKQEAKDSKVELDKMPF